MNKGRPAQQYSHLQSQQPFGTLDNTIVQDEDEQSVQQVKDIPNQRRFPNVAGRKSKKQLYEEPQQPEFQRVQRDQKENSNIQSHQSAAQSIRQKNNQMIDQSQQMEMYQRQENDTSFQEREKEKVSKLQIELKTKIEYYNDLIAKLKNQEQEIQLKINELQLDPLVCLQDTDRLKEKIKQLKQGYIQEFAMNFKPNTAFESNYSLKQENEEFYSLLGNAYDLTEMNNKIEILKNFELRLVEERIKQEIVEDYLKKEINVVKAKSDQLEEEIMRYRMLNELEKVLQEESKALDQKKLEQSQNFQSQQNIMTSSFKRDNYFDVQKNTFANAMKDSSMILDRQSQVTAKQSEIESLKISLEKDAIDAINQKNLIDKQRRKLYDQNDQTIQELILENKRLQEELQFAKANLGRQNGIQNMENMSYDEEIQNQKEAKDLKTTFVMLRFLEKWIYFYMKKQKTIRKGNAFNLWKIKTLVSEVGKLAEGYEREESHPLVVDYKWKQTRDNWIREKRYPMKVLSKNRRDYEYNLFDIERKRFWKQKIVGLFNNIFRNQRKRERLLKVVGFHTFIKNASFMTRVPVPRQFSTHYTEDMDQAIKSHMRKTSQNRQQQIQKAQGPSNTSNNQNKSTVKKGDKSPIRQKTNEKEVKQSVEEQNQKLARAFGKQVQQFQGVMQIYQYHKRRDLEDNQKLAIAFARWLQYTLGQQNKFLEDELQSINFVLNERVFRENLFRTKLRLTRSEINSKVTLINELVQTILANYK